MTDTASFSFDNSYARLQDKFFVAMSPTPVAAPSMIRLNKGLAQHLGLDARYLNTDEGLAFFAGNEIPKGAHPLAMAYGGHQYGRWAHRLGDGRAILLGEHINQEGIRNDIVLKGSGRTPFSRRGDGRAALGPILREYIVSEAMAVLGVPTTRALAAVTTGEMVLREGPMPGAILTRIAKSHVRVGTFELFAAERDMGRVRELADYVIQRHYPQALETDNPYLSFLKEVISAQAKLIAEWQLIGFIHGVMNTDNMSIAGETIDYGPCAFMDRYHSDTVYSSIDRYGRYAYCNQPQVAHWNLSCLAQALVPLLGAEGCLGSEQAMQALNAFPEQFETAYLDGLRPKLGLVEKYDGDKVLGEDLLRMMEENKADFTLTFRALSKMSATVSQSDDEVRQRFENPDHFDEWAVQWRRRLSLEFLSDTERQSLMNKTNPSVIARNHLVEEAIRAAVDHNDFGPFEALVSILETPYVDQPEGSLYILPPRDDQVVQATFCGT